MHIHLANGLTLKRRGDFRFSRALHTGATTLRLAAFPDITSISGP